MTSPLNGWKILVPRGGTWGNDVADAVSARGGFPIVAPLINFANPSPDDARILAESLDRLQEGAYDWVVATSATAVDVLLSHGVAIPDSTLVAAVGETTAAGLGAGGYRVDFVPSHDNSAKGMLSEWVEARRGMPQIRVLWLRSEIAKPVVAQGLRRRGHLVDSVVAYRTVGVPVAESIRYDVSHGRIRGILVTSGSVAGQIHNQFDPLPPEVKLAAIGPRTSKDARELGLRIDVIAQQRTVASLLDGLEWLALGGAMPATAAVDIGALIELEQHEAAERADQASAAASGADAGSADAGGADAGGADWGSADSVGGHVPESPKE
ncbi:MAG: uroporphyrinogen-III synthase [Pseudoclavibacter sp.]